MKRRGRLSRLLVVLAAVAGVGGTAASPASGQSRQVRELHRSGPFAAAAIEAEARTRYVLTYIPRGVEAGGWHPLEARLKGRAGKVTARRGYLR